MGKQNNIKSVTCTDEHLLQTLNFARLNFVNVVQCLAVQLKRNFTSEVGTLLLNLFK